MKKIVLALVVALAVVIGAASAWSRDSHDPEGPMAKGSDPMCGHMAGKMGPGMGGMMHGRGLMEPGVMVKVEKIKNGATITLTSEDLKQVRRIQKRAEIMRLMHELHEEEPEATQHGEE